MKNIFTFRRKVRLTIAAALSVTSLAIFMLSSMAGPHQITYLEITALCNAGLIVLAGI